MSNINKKDDIEDFRDAFTTVIRYVSTHRKDFSENKEQFIKAEKDIDIHLDVLRIYMERRCNKCGCFLDASQFYDGKGLCHKCSRD